MSETEIENANEKEESTDEGPNPIGFREKEVSKLSKKELTRLYKETSRALEHMKTLFIEHQEKTNAQIDALKEARNEWRTQSPPRKRRSAKDDEPKGKPVVDKNNGSRFRNLEVEESAVEMEDSNSEGEERIETFTDRKKRVFLRNPREQEDKDWDEFDKIIREKAERRQSTALTQGPKKGLTARIVAK